MRPEGASSLAANGAQTLVAAMPTPVWPAVREQALVLFRAMDPHRADGLAPVLDENAQLMAETPFEEREDVRLALVPGWRRRLERLLDENPAAEEALRGLVERIGAALPAGQVAGKSQTNIAKDQATLYAVMDGNIIQHQHSKPAAAMGTAEQDGEDDRNGPR